MAAKPTATPKQQQQTLPEPASIQLPAAGIDFAADAGAGLEGADKESFAIPFLLVLQPGSPQVLDATIEGARAGAMMNSVTQTLYPNELFIVPCAFQRRWIRWGARDAGGGFKGELTSAEVAQLREKGVVKELEGRLYFPAPDGSVNPKTCDHLSDTRSHFVLMMGAPTDDIATPAIFALTSTGIKVSKNLLSRIEAIKQRHPSTGVPFTPPSFSHVYRVSTIKKTNDKGTWFLPEIALVGPVSNPGIYAQARAFHKQVTEGKVSAAYDTAQQPGGGGGEEEGSAF